MKGIGILVNILAALVGGGFGLMFRGKLRVSVQQLIYRLMGLVALGIGAFEVIDHYFVMAGGEVELTGSLLVIIALVVGGLMGHLFGMDRGLWAIGKKLSLKDQKGKEVEADRVAKLSRAVEISVERGMKPPRVPFLDKLPTYEMPAPLSKDLVGDGFLLSVVFLCANALLLNGGLEDALWGETTPLLIKSGMDFLFCFLFAMMMGTGSLYAVIPMAAMELGLWVLCLLLPDFMGAFFTPTLIAQLSVIGAVTLIFLGVQMAFNRKKPNAAIFLPASLIPLLYYGILFVIQLLVEE